MRAQSIASPLKQLDAPPDQSNHPQWPIADDAAVPPPPQPTPATMNAEELLDRAVQETVIAAGLGTFRTVGEALTRINVRRLYRQDYATFEAYIQSRWDMRPAYAYQVMSAATITNELAAIADLVPNNEAQARPLTKLDPDQRKAVWIEVAARVREGTPLTAKLVTEVRDEMVPAETEAIITPVNPNIDEEFESGYLFGDWSEMLANLTVEQIGLVLIPALAGDTPEEEAESLTRLLDGLKAKDWTNYHVLVITKFDDFRKLIDIGEEATLEFGGIVTWSSKKERTANAWSFSTTKQHILHFRRGEAALANRSADVLECEYDPKCSSPPVAVVRELIQAAIPAGGVVIVAPGGEAAASLACLETDHRCIEIESDAEAYFHGKERLERHTPTVQNIELGGEL